MKIERHETGPRMSKAVIHGDTVYLAGIVADGPKGKSVAEQTKNILSQIDGFLQTPGRHAIPHHTPGRAREKSLNFFALGHKKWGN